MPDSAPGAALSPLPAAARARTLSASWKMGNGFHAVKQVADFIGDGVARADLASHLLQTYPHWSERRPNRYLNHIRSLGVFTRRGAMMLPTDSGRDLQRTGDPDSLRDRVLTSILGFDHLLVWLSERPRSRSWLLDRLPQVNQGWTTDIVPKSWLDWTMWLDLAVETSDGFVLTERGKAWRSLIHWNPEPLT